MKVYLVTDGDYSDYSVLAAFSTQEKAVEYCKTQFPRQTTQGPGIEPYELDPAFTPKVFKSRWRVTLDLETGALETSRNQNNPFEEKDVEWDGTRGRWFVTPPNPPYSFSEHQLRTGEPFRQGVRVATVANVQGISFVSEEHAMKLAVEGRQAWLREKFTDYRQFEEKESPE